MNAAHVLVVEDDEDIRKLLQVILEKEGYRVSVLSSGEKVMPWLLRESTDLILLDIMLPVVDGRRLCRDIRAHPNLKKIPIIMLTAKSEETDVVTGLELGADDYITKPFSPKVVVARIRALIRRQEENLHDNDDQEIHIHNIVIHPGRHEVLLDGKAAKLTLTEFQILDVLAKRPGWVFSRHQIVDRIRGKGYAVTTRAIDVQIVGLRKKLGKHGDCIETVRGVGYKMKE